MTLLASLRTTAMVSVSLGALGAVASAQETTELPPINVEGAGSSTDSGDRILQKTTRSATKTDVPVLETPQSVSTVTRRQIDEQNPQTVSQALRYTAGVLSDRDSDIRYDSVFLRGFGAFGTATSYVSFLDGLKLPRGQAFAQTSVDPFLIDRIDVLKGPSALLYGQISPGGLVNQISRSPSAEQSGEVRIEGGSYGRVQGSVRTSGPLTDDGAWQYAFSAIGRSSGTRYDDVDEERFGVAPVIKWSPSDDTTLTLSGYYQKDPEGGYFNSLYARSLAPAAYRPHLDRKLNIGDPSYDDFKREQYGLGYNFEHRFDEALTVRSNLRYSSVDIDFRSLQMAGPITADGQIPRQALRSIEDVGGLSFDNQAQINIQTGDIRHTILTGVDFQNATSDWEYRFGAASPLDVVDPVYGVPIGPLSTIIDSRQKLRQTGVYVQDQLSWGRWRAQLGLRHDWTKQDSENRLEGSKTKQDNEATSYRAGLLYLFDSGLAPYVSYSTSFEPTIGVDAGGAPFIPTKARQYEAGVKYQPAGVDALFTFSAFNIRQQNVLTASSTPGFNIQDGEVRSRGLEFEARGNLTGGVELIAALTLLDTEFTESSVTGDVGKRPQGVPDHYGSVWANYRFDGGALAGLSLGGGVRFVGASYADNANAVRAAPYTLLDAALRYDFGANVSQLRGLEATLNVTNLLDKDYYSSCSSNFYCQFGNRRQALAGLRYTW
jgi:iron complex outermembrane receptor protein